MMIYRGKVRDGVVVLDNPDALPEGTEVKISPIAAPTTIEPVVDPLFQMTELAIETGIPDLATNIDHYLYGHSRAASDE